MDAATAGLNAQLENASADLQLVAHRLEAQVRPALASRRLIDFASSTGCSSPSRCLQPDAARQRCLQPPQLADLLLAVAARRPAAAVRATSSPHTKPRRAPSQFNARDVPEAHNPLELQARIDRLRARVPGLQADCATIAAKKHELSESTTKMVANRQAIACVAHAPPLPTPFELTPRIALLGRRLLQRRSGTRIPAELPLAQA